MAIKTIDELDELQTVGENDYLVVSSKNSTTDTYETKKAKASAIGSESPIEIIEVDYNGGALRTVLTAGEIKALAEQGKVFMVAVTPQPGVLSYANVASLVLDDNGCTMDIYVVNDGTFTSIGLSASSDNDVLTVMN